MDYLDLKLDNETFLQKNLIEKSHNSFDRNMCLIWKVWSQISDVNSIKYFLFSPFRKVAPALVLECLQLDPLRSCRLAEKSPPRRQKKQHEKRVKMNVKWQWEGRSVEQAQRHKDECKVSLSPLESSSLWRMAGKASFFICTTQRLNPLVLFRFSRAWPARFSTEHRWAKTQLQ